MNQRNLKQIFANYIDRFEELNNSDHEEYYKWQIAKEFRPMMDAALDAAPEDLPMKLYEVKKRTFNLIDSYTQPFHGLVKFSEHEPETVRNMFRKLFASADDDLDVQQERIREFLDESHKLRDKYFPESYLYNDDMHSVTAYLFLYDPEKNYLFKATHALKFADCIEFYEDWGSGENVKLDVYYRMCDRLVEEIKADDAIMKTDASRFDSGWGIDPATLHSDNEKHILAFDLIYCCSTYGLFKGIDFDRPNSKEKQLINEKRKAAKEYLVKFEEASAENQKLQDAIEYLEKLFAVDSVVVHKSYGKGKILENSDTKLKIEFESVGEKTLGLIPSVVNGLIKPGTVDDSSHMTEVVNTLKRRDRITSVLNYAEKLLSEYAEFLD